MSTPQNFPPLMMLFCTISAWSSIFGKRAVIGFPDADRVSVIGLSLQPVASLRFPTQCCKELLKAVRTDPTLCSETAFSVVARPPTLRRSHPTDTDSLFSNSRRWTNLRGFHLSSVPLYFAWSAPRNNSWRAPISSFSSSVIENLLTPRWANVPWFDSYVCAVHSSPFSTRRLGRDFPPVGPACSILHLAYELPAPCLAFALLHSILDSILGLVFVSPLI